MDATAMAYLAAGIGSRLGNPFPKPLTPLANGKSIMQMQVEHLSAVFNADDIHVVVGFKKELIMERFPELTFIYNPYFDQTNTSKSLLRALKKDLSQDVLWLNGDVVFDGYLLEALQPVMREGSSFVSVNTSRCEMMGDPNSRSSRSLVITSLPNLMSA